MKRKAFQIGSSEVLSGQRVCIDLPVANLSNHTPITLPVHVLHGTRDGPTMFVSAAIHGDEVLGVEIIRRLLASKSLKSLRGTLLCVPIVNAFGFISQQRYLPDRRDLNRSFPGTSNGSLAGQLAHLFLNEVVLRSDLGIDLHTGAINRSNLPQLRGDFSKPELRQYARTFGAPIALHSRLREGSLRGAAEAAGVPVLLYEAGEALRLDEVAIRVGLKGILNLMQNCAMISERRSGRPKAAPMFSRSSKWIRAPMAGLFSAHRALGAVVSEGETIGQVMNPYDGTMEAVTARFDGVIIGRTNISVVNQADALFHIATVRDHETVEERVELITNQLSGDPIFDDDEIV